MFRQKKDRSHEEVADRLPIYKPAECLGAACVYFTGTNCSSRLELLQASGKSGGTDKAPQSKDCSYALYGQVCMGGEEQVVVNLKAESPNGQASVMELIGRMGQLEDQHIVLQTPLDKISY